MIELTATDGHQFSAYRADPADTPKGAVVVLQEIFGIDSHIQKITDAFAAKGYVAIAPSLFDRVKPGVNLAYDESGISDGLAMTQQIDRQQLLGDIQVAVDAVKSAGKVAIVGYCWGGELAYASANRVSGIACVVGYYGNDIVNNYSEKRKVPTLLHFGENDSTIPMEQVTQFRAYRPDVSAFTYPGAAHGFSCDRREGYQEDAAEKALDRTLSWISQYVEGQPPILLKNAGIYAQQKAEKKKKKKSGGDDLGPPMD
ncbi:dienelactone hydrolase family protein [Bradyrhizobium sp.]|uniref:dienelactone hydrolase family protein n=1 Tax=Bradyrhizobium sp. TaxID=376 RepID=UPI003C36F0D8